MDKLVDDATSKSARELAWTEIPFHYVLGSQIFLTKTCFWCDYIYGLIKTENQDYIYSLCGTKILLLQR